MSELPVVQLSLSTALVETLIESEYSWYDWSDGEVHGHPVLGSIEIVASHSLGDDISEYYQYETFLVFKVTLPTGEVLHYKKNGTYSSYEGTDWTGPFTLVKPVQKVVFVYE